MKFGEVDLNSWGSKVGVMIVFSDLWCDFGIFQSKEGEFSGLSLLVSGDFTVCDLVRKGFEMLLDFFLCEGFGDVLDDDSAHELYGNTFLL